MKKGVLGIVVVAALIGVGKWFWFNTTVSESALSTGVTHEIVRTEVGYEPVEITIGLGDTVIFKNMSGEYHWPASDLHPTHGVYPEFDPKRPVGLDEDWSFTFTQAGEWKFHDHLRANKLGVIHVQN